MNSCQIILNEVRQAAQHLLDNMPDICYSDEGYTCYLIEEYTRDTFGNGDFTAAVLSEISPSFISSVLNPRLEAIGIKPMGITLSSFIVRYWEDATPSSEDELFTLRKEWLTFIINFIDTHNEKLVDVLISGYTIEL